MDNILILGSLPKNKLKEELYNSMAEICKKYAKEVSTPIETAGFKGSYPERYELAFKKVRETDFIIGELSEPSTGQGMEIREAAILKKPLVVVAKEKSKVSGLVKGCPVLEGIVYYRDLEDLKTKLNKFLKGYC